MFREFFGKRDVPRSSLLRKVEGDSGDGGLSGEVAENASREVQTAGEAL